MKLALYMPNFRDKISVDEIDALAETAEALDFDSIWTLDRVVVPESSDRVELAKSFGTMKEFPNALPVSSRGEFLQGPALIPYLAATTKKVRLGVSIIVTPFRAPRCHGGRGCHLGPIVARQNQRRSRRWLDAGRIPGGGCRAHLPQAQQTRSRNHRSDAGHLD